MKIFKTNMQGLCIIQPEIHGDKRGYFYESFRDDIFKKKFPDINFCQENESMSSFGVLRGLHYQIYPNAQSKLVRVIHGKVLDVVVDIRKKSKTFGKYLAIELSSKNKKQLFIPKGFAHGFVVLSEKAIFSYKVDSYYNKSSERGIAYNDEFLAIDWKVDFKEMKISEKDLNQPHFNDADYL